MILYHCPRIILSLILKLLLYLVRGGHNRKDLDYVVICISQAPIVNLLMQKCTQFAVNVFLFILDFLEKYVLCLF